MGACLGQCYARISDTFTYRYRKHTGTPFQEAEPVELCQLTEGENSASEPRGSKHLLSLLSLKRFKKKRGIPDELELTEGTSWSRGSNKYSRLNTRSDLSTSSGFTTPMQTLDARNLLKHQGCITSTPASSLDLEWEHEVLPMATIQPSQELSPNDSLSRTSLNASPPSSLTASPWSRISTPNSLEWDPVEAEIEGVDVETEQLLTEIERLTDKALKETGDWSGTC
ncbi:uncharacterized protein [Venturia canescens]|uniref:uncharacterized protein n=1 Tax=Venturia canescens TaxID=32260 RepID=UPI001C9BF8D3|nr:uncharacterized protein LOC122409609 [Venturia canescens]